MKIAILGAGAFGTALGAHLKHLSHDAVVWTRSAAKALEIPTGSNHEALPGIDFDRGVAATTDLDEALVNADLAVLATPSLAIREALSMVEARRSGCSVR